MKFQMLYTGARLVVALALLADAAFGSDRLVGIAPHDGLAMFVKAFTVSAGSTIEGAQFATDGTSVYLPEVSLLRGPAGSLQQATTVTSVEDVASEGRSSVSVTWPSPVEVGQDGTYYVVVKLPAAPCRLGLHALQAPNGSYVTSADDGAFVPVVGDLAIGLLPAGLDASALGNSAFKVQSGGPETEEKPQTFLQSAAPNPTSRLTAIEFGLERPGAVRLVVYDVAGREVRRLMERELASGPHTVQWDGRDGEGRSVATGVYLVNLRLGEKLLTERVVITK
jgi:hypothetical protein